LYSIIIAVLHDFVVGTCLCKCLASLQKSDGGVHCCAKCCCFMQRFTHATLQ